MGSRARSESPRMSHRYSAGMARESRPRWRAIAARSIECSGSTHADPSDVVQVGRVVNRAQGDQLELSDASGQLEMRDVANGLSKKRATDRCRPRRLWLTSRHRR